MDKVKTPAGPKPVPMKLFATWEVDRTPSNCIPRLCCLSLSRLVVGGAGLGGDVSSLTIAVKVQGSKRTLRSNEMALQADGNLDTELQLNFSLQYPHLLKRQGNKLHVMLQRRKRYKNRTILGYKTLAEGTLDMSLVLQREMDLELDLVNGKDGKNVLGRVSVVCLNSQPVDYDGGKARGEFSDDDEEYSSNEDLSDSEQESRPSQAPGPTHQNLKQKFIAILKKFKIYEESLIPERKGVDPAEIADLFDELEDMSDSGGEADTVSITSTPKPSLRPFFSSTRSLISSESPLTPASNSLLQQEAMGNKKDSDSHNDSDATPSSSPPKLTETLQAKDSSLTAKKKILRDKACGFLQEYNQEGD